MMVFIKKQTGISVLMCMVLVGYGCSDSSPKKVRNRCVSPTVSECLDSSVVDACLAENDGFVDLCEQTIDAYGKSGTKTKALVPELYGATNKDRAILDVIHQDQSPLYIHPEETPDRFSMRSVRNTLLSINDILVNDTPFHSDVFGALDDNFALSPEIQLLLPAAIKTKSKITPVLTTEPVQFMFDNLSYTKPIILGLLDSLYVGKVQDWDDNGLQIESCEEYVFERYYGYTLFRDFADLHQDNPMRVAEYAYQRAYVDEGGIHVTESKTQDGYAVVWELPAGAIGSRRFSVYSGGLIQKKGVAVLPDPLEMYWNYQSGGPNYGNDVLEDKYKDAGYRLNAYYSKWPGSPGSTAIVYDNHYSTQSYLQSYLNTDVSGELLPKNFFLETLGKMNPDNTARSAGVILSQADLLSVYDQPDFNDAATAQGNTGYISNWHFHLVMLAAAKRVEPNEKIRKSKLEAMALLRKHLIDLLAERAYWERKLQTTYFFTTPSEAILRNAKTLSLSEKAYAQQKLDEFISGHMNNAPDSYLTLIPSQQIVSYPAKCDDLDDQIEAVLLKAKTAGALETDTGSGYHNYPMVGNTPIVQTRAADGYRFDLAYDKVFCDWSPEIFTQLALALLPDEVLDKAYDKCQRITAGDFVGMNPADFTFDFPTDCSDDPMFNLWQPNTPVDYTRDTTQFTKFEKLLEVYPTALSDCDALIEKGVQTELESRGMNYYDPVSGKVMMSKSSSFFKGFGGSYAGLRLGYAMGWLYEGYDTIDEITTTDTEGALDRDYVCNNTNYFSFGNYFVEGSFLKHDFVLCAAGSYASNKTTGVDKPEPPTLANPANSDKINQDIQAVAEQAPTVTTTHFMFIKNEKMTYSYDETTGWTDEPVNTSHKEAYDPVTREINYQNDAVSDTQMLSIRMQQSVPVCGIISITVKGAVTGDIDADTTVTGDNRTEFAGSRCKAMNFHYTPRIDFDGFASAAVTAGISGVASISAGTDIALKFVGIRFPYETALFITQTNDQEITPDRKFNYDVHTNVYSSLDYAINVLSGHFGAFVEIDYTVDSTTYRQTLFSWDGYSVSGNLDRVGDLTEVGSRQYVKLPVRALYGLSKKLY